MTKSTITRERIEQYANDPRMCNINDEIRELARMALAAMDSEPDCKERKLFCSTDTARMRKVISVSAGTGDAPLYRHVQPAPVVPEGYKLVPTELTSEMVKAFRSFCEAYDDDLIAGYKAMLAAAPQEVK